MANRIISSFHIGHLSYNVIFMDKHHFGQIKAAALNTLKQVVLHWKRKLEGKCKAMCFYICEIKAI